MTLPLDKDKFTLSLGSDLFIIEELDKLGMMRDKFTPESRIILQTYLLGANVTFARDKNGKFYPSTYSKLIQYISPLNADFDGNEPPN